MYESNTKATLEEREQIQKMLAELNFVEIQNNGSNKWVYAHATNPNGSITLEHSLEDNLKIIDNGCDKFVEIAARADNILKKKYVHSV